jgi:DNA-directed RNA polymerase subunit N (RpoN/RPB10)
MDAAILNCKNFNDFLENLKGVGVEIKHGNQLVFKLPGGKKFFRQDTLGDDYSVDAVIERIAGKRVVVSSTKDNLLTQIERCIVPKGSPGYDRWATVFNLKQIAKTFNFLQENNLLDYVKLEEKARQSVDDFNGIKDRIDYIGARLPEIASLQKHVGTYIKTKDIFAKYRESGWSKKFHAAHKEAIESHKEAKKAFNELGIKKLPTIKMLQTEYATLSEERKNLYSRYKDARQFMQDIMIVKQNSERLLGYSALPIKSRGRDER